jgi:hypothetical protein
MSEEYFYFEIRTLVLEGIQRRAEERRRVILQQEQEAREHMDMLLKPVEGLRKRAVRCSQPEAPHIKAQQ